MLACISTVKQQSMRLLYGHLGSAARTFGSLGTRFGMFGKASPTYF